MDEPFDIEIEKMIAEIEASAAGGDARAVYDLSMLHHDLAMRRLSREEFATAERLLREAAAAGLSDAAKMLGDWEVLRYCVRTPNRSDT